VLGLDAIGTIVNAPAGSGEITVRDATYLAGYATTEKRPYLPDIWRTILLMRTDVAFAPLTKLLWTIIVLAMLLAALAAAGSLYWATQFSRPIMSLVPFLKSVADSLGPEGRWVHLGLTSQDVWDTATALQLRDSASIIEEDLEPLRDVLEKRAIEFKDTLCIGRTHGVHAEPTTFGLKLLGFASEVRRAQGQ